MPLTKAAASSAETETPASYTRPFPSSHETLLSFLAMNPSRLETTCKVTFDPVASPRIDIVPPSLERNQTAAPQTCVRHIRGTPENTWPTAIANSPRAEP